MNRISQYIKVVGGIQQESWNFYYGPTGIDKVQRLQGGIPNLSIDYTTDTKGRILSETYNETGGYSGELFVVYDNFGNMADLRDNSGNSAKAVLVDPNNGAIDSRYDPAGIDDPFVHKARQKIQYQKYSDISIAFELFSFSYFSVFPLGLILRSHFFQCLHSRMKRGMS